jgi:hypothetical protein
MSFGGRLYNIPAKSYAKLATGLDQGIFSQKNFGFISGMPQFCGLD